MTKKKLLVRIGVFAVATICIFVFAAFFHTSEYDRSTSDDGRFYAVAEYRTYLSLLPMMPGHSSDKPGTVTIYSRDGVSCGCAEIPMLWLFRDLKWNADTAQIGPMAEWDLAKRTVRQNQ